ncbi:hypothetical protein [Thalassotalea ganghwensis]
MSLVKSLLKYTALAVVLLLALWLWVGNTTESDVAGLDYGWSKLKWFFRFLTLSMIVFAYFAWDEIGKVLARQTNREDALEILREIKAPIFAVFGVLWVVGMML